VRLLLRAAPVAAVIAAACASGASAADAPTVDKSPLLWATINICDTAKHPDTIGIRASMPGSGKRRERMYMRFQVQYFRESVQKRAPTDATVDSGFKSVGAATFRRRESGWNFSLTPPPEGQTYRLRGVVSFEWRVGKKVVRKAQKRTRAGHEGTYGADPKGFSAAECTVKR
jgi:opacity protein-like surface antigen